MLARCFKSLRVGHSWLACCSLPLTQLLQLFLPSQPGVEGALNHGAGGPQADSRHPVRICERYSCTHQIDPISSKMNSNSSQKLFHNFFRVPCGCYALGQRGQTYASGGLLTPRPRGTIYEALPFILGLFQRSMSQTDSHSEPEEKQSAICLKANYKGQAVLDWTPMIPIPLRHLSE